MIRRFLLVWILGLSFVCPVHPQPPAPAGAPPRSEAIYTPRPVYRPEWAKQGLSGKGVVLVTIDRTTGKVAGAKMLESTGNQLLDGAALEAYSKWQFKPGSSVTQVKMPIEFRPRPAAQSSNQKASPTIVYLLLILVGFAAAAMMFRGRRNT